MGEDLVQGAKGLSSRSKELIRSVVGKFSRILSRGNKKNQLLVCRIDCM